jgi:hypothetical protein
MKNYDIWNVVWAKDNVICTLTISCLEDVLYKVIDSIYVMEVG